MSYVAECDVCGVLERGDLEEAAELAEASIGPGGVDDE